MTALPSHPRVGRARVPRVVVVACVVSVTVCGAWAVWPVTQELLAVPELRSASKEGANPAAVLLNLDAFQAPVWIAAATSDAEAEPAPPAQPRPLRIQLLAIVREGSVLRAAVYDPDRDALFIVGEGESVEDRIIEKIVPTAVTLRDGARTSTLLLREGDGSASR